MAAESRDLSQQPTGQTEWPPLLPEFKFQAFAGALLVVDVQNFSVGTEHGWGPYFRAQYPRIASYYYSRVNAELLPNLVALIDAFRSRRRPVIYLTVGPHLPDGSDFLSLRHAAAVGGSIPAVPNLGTPGHAIPAEIAPATGEIVLNKVTRSGFASTGLDQILRNLGVAHLAVAGVVTNACVESTARHATDFGYATTVIADATATFDPETHAASLLAFRRTFGMVRSSSEILTAMRAGN